MTRLSFAQPSKTDVKSLDPSQELVGSRFHDGGPSQAILPCASLAFRVVGKLPEVEAQDVGAGLFILHSGVENLGIKAPVVVRRDVVLEDVCQVGEVFLNATFLCAGVSTGATHLG